MILALALACAPDAPVPPVVDGPTWHQDVAPIVAGHCAGCHTDGGVNFALDSFAAAAPNAELMAVRAEARTMPPWGAQDTPECEPERPWKDDLRLSDAEIATVRAWADAGAPEGDPATAAPLPEPVSLDLDGADQHLQPTTPRSVEPGSDDFRCFVLDPALAADAWLTGLQVDVDNSAVLHHIVVFLDEARESESKAAIGDSYACFGSAGLSDTRLLGAWAPGATPFQTPEGTGIHVPAGSLIVAQAHYHPTADTVETDASGLDLRWADTAPERQADFLLIGNADGSIPGYGGLLDDPDDRDGTPEFRIPAGAAAHSETMEFKLQRGDGPIQVFSVGTHMHYVGVDMQIDVDYGNRSERDGEHECLLRTPDWDFNWQRGYGYDVPLDEVPVLQQGDTLRLRCTYDNTVANDGTRLALEQQDLDDPVDVYLGETTLDEMCLGAFGVVY